MAIGIIDMNGAVSWDVIREALSRADAVSCRRSPLARTWTSKAAARRKPLGVTRIVSNGQFHSDMAGLIDRYRRR